MKLSPDKVLARVRKLCLSYPESNETAAWGHPNFRAGKKAFVTFERWEGRPSIAFRVQDAEREKVRSGGEFFVKVEQIRGMIKSMRGGVIELKQDYAAALDQVAFAF